MTNELRFTCTVGKALATGMIVHKFRVMEGSVVQDVRNSLKDHQGAYYKKRISLQRSGIIKNGKFTTDYDFDTVSEATCVILGTSSANFNNWKLAEEHSMHEIFDNPKRVRGKAKNVIHGNKDSVTHKR